MDGRNGLERMNRGTKQMKKCMNLIAVFDKSRQRLLVCRRKKEPFKGLLNLVGGKAKPGEDGEAAAYRELEEETGITGADIRLFHLIDFVYHTEDLLLESYVGYLKEDVDIHGDENELLWINREQDFFDRKTFAGHGNLGHLMELLKIYEQQGAFAEAASESAGNLEPQKLSARYTVKPFTKEDIPDIYALCQGNPIYYKHMKTEPTAENLEESMTALPKGMTMKDKLFAGFYREGHLVALLDLITGYPNRQTAFIGWFMMEKAMQGTGIGSAIVADILACLKKEGFSWVRLGYIKGNLQSEGFWKKNGFLPTGVESKTDNYTIVVMQKEL